MFEQISKFANEASTTVTGNVNDTIKNAGDIVTSAVNDNSKRFTTASDQVLDAVLDANRRIVDVAVTNIDRLNGQLEVELPFADRVPTPTVAGERYLDFVERAVSLNREMNQRVVDMITADTADTAETTAKKTPTTA